MKLASDLVPNRVLMQPSKAATDKAWHLEIQGVELICLAEQDVLDDCKGTILTLADAVACWATIKYTLCTCEPQPLYDDALINPSGFADKKPGLLDTHAQFTANGRIRQHLINPQSCFL